MNGQLRKNKKLKIELENEHGKGQQWEKKGEKTPHSWCYGKGERAMDGGNWNILCLQ